MGGENKMKLERKTNHKGLLTIEKKPEGYRRGIGGGMGTTG